MDGFWHSFEEYIRSYLPQWRYDKDGGEPEGALLFAAARLVEDSRARLEELPRRHELEFLSGWPLEPLPAAPMAAYAALSAPKGVRVPSGHEFYLSGDGARLWRTAEEVWAGPLRLEDQILAGGSRGKLIPLPAPAAGEPVVLFDFRPAGGQRQAVRFTHPDAFASHGGCGVELLLPDASEALLDFLSGEAVEWTLLCGPEGALPIGPPRRDGPALALALPPAPEGWAVQAQARGAAPPGAAGRVLVRTRRTALPPALVWGDGGALARERWLPFGDAPEAWKTCCLSCPDALGLRGARVTVGFTLSIAEHEERLPGTEGEPEYRPVMRRLPPPPPAPRDVWADQVDWEYWNGAGWLPIPGSEGYAGVFGPGEPPASGLEFGFNWPGDAAPCRMGGQSGFWLRWRVRRAEGSGWLPRRCHAPEIAGPRFSAVLDGAPVEVLRASGLDAPFVPLTDSREPLFPSLCPEGDWWWLGFDRPPEGEPLRLYLSLRERLPGSRLSAWEGTQGGNRPLVLEDGTDGLAHSGALAITGVRGGMTERFGRRRWWLGLRDDGMALAQGRHPRLDGLAWGAVRLLSQGEGGCASGEPLSPLRGGPLQGVTLTASFGGCAAEGREEWLRRARAARRHLGRAVSARDVDEILCSEVRDVLRTRCVLTGTVLTVGVLLRDLTHHEAAFARRREEIRRLLERTSALPALGLELKIREPSFYAVNTTVWLCPDRDTSFESAREKAEDALNRFLHPAAGNLRGVGWRLGELPTAPQLTAFLREELPGAPPRRVTLTAAAPDGRELDCAQVRDPFALPVSGAHIIHRLWEEVFA